MEKKQIVGLDEYQERSGAVAIYPNRGNNLTYTLLGLGNEAGEAQGKLKKAIRDDGGMLTEQRKYEIAKELGDTLWYLAQSAHEIGLPLSMIAQINIDKLEDRKDRGVLGGSGDNR